MKKVLFILALFLVVSCGEKAEEQIETDENVVIGEAIAVAEALGVEVTEATAKGSIAEGDCDKFLDDYEKWVDEYIKLYKQVIVNPMDTKNIEMYQKSAKELENWSKRWVDLMACAGEEKYQKRMDEIAAKVEKAMEE